MQNPQLENGYTRIANEILDGITKTKLNGTQFKIIITVWRYTYGFGRKEHEFSLSFLAEATNTNKDQIKRELNNLIDKNIITVVKEASFNSSRVIAFNKLFEQWVLEDTQGAKKPTEDKEEYTQGANTHTPQGANPPTKKENTKENIKEIYTTQTEELWKLYPDKKGKQKAIAKIPKLIKQHTYEQMERAIKRYIADVEKRRNEGFKTLQHQNGSTFFNGTYIDFLDDNYKEPEQVNNDWRKGWLENA